MRILISGVSGFVGQHLAQYLSDHEKNAEIFGIERNIRPFELFPSLTKKIKVINCDITNKHEVDQAINQIRPQEVYHLAGFASGAGKDRELIFSVNIDGTVNLLESLTKVNLPVKVLLASTAYVYGAVKKCANEKALLCPKSYYDQSKVKMEIESRRFISDDLQIIITRATNHAGAGQSLGFVVPDLAQQIASAKDDAQILVGNLQAKRDLFDVRDCIMAYHLVMKKGLNGEVYNLGSGKVRSIKEILEKLIKLSGKKISYKIDPLRTRPSDILLSCVDLAKIKALGWKTHIKLDQTLQDVLCYWQRKVGEAS